MAKGFWIRDPDLVERITKLGTILGMTPEDTVGHVVKTQTPHLLRKLKPELFDVVELLENINEIPKGTRGAVIVVHHDGDAFEIETADNMTLVAAKNAVHVVIPHA